MAPHTSSNPRARFAERLRALRAMRGFERARYFASALGIEENRYTRYERAEVEPSLALLHKMCATLDVTPNELLGFPSGESRDGALPVIAGMAEEQAPLPITDAAPTRNQIAWRLAAEAAAIHGRAAREPADPLAQMRDTATLFRRLQSDPFATVSEILEAPELDTLDAAAKARIADLVAALTSSP
ncbi:MAG: helix-turn-helix domain-containing protein [Hyphomicrobiaceae bacterium]